MLRFSNYDIVFQEVPNEVTLAINISNCPNNCKGCHSPHLLEDKGDILNEYALEELLKKYGNAITCVCFMGGDSDPHQINRLASFLHEKNIKIKTAWYSGKDTFSPECNLNNFDYIKLGPYIEALGGLNSPDTNQRLYKVKDKNMIDITGYFLTKRVH